MAWSWQLATDERFRSTHLPLHNSTDGVLVECPGVAAERSTHDNDRVGRVVMSTESTGSPTSSSPAARSPAAVRVFRLVDRDRARDQATPGW